MGKSCGDDSLLLLVLSKGLAVVLSRKRNPNNGLWDILFKQSRSADSCLVSCVVSFSSSACCHWKTTEGLNSKCLM